jgi:holliday junction DNA helicase RuvA
MIASIKGLLAHKCAGDIIVDVNGIGYLIAIPLSTFYVLPEIGQPVSLTIHTHVKEDALQLYGFQTPEEKMMFQLMISVSGIGPRLAINILSGISAHDLAAALAAGQLTKLTGIPGIGKKMAERLVFELKGKVPRLSEESATTLTASSMGAHQAMLDDALSALINLGYKNSIATEALEKTMKNAPQDLTLEDLLKQTLKRLGD